MSITSRALWYIETHLHGDVRLESILDAVAADAGVSRFHLSRAFAATTGLPVSGYTRARRMTEAAKALADGAPDIFTVALDLGYGSHEAFTRAFHQYFGVTPQAVRTRGLAGLTLQEAINMQPMQGPKQTTVTLAAPRKVEGETLLVFGLNQKYKGSNAGIPAQWDKFGPYLGSIQHQKGAAGYGVVHNMDDAGNFEYLCGVEVSEFPAEPAHFTALRIAPQTYAVFQHSDHVSSIGVTWKEVWEHGLSDAGYQVADGPFYERYGPEFDGRTGVGGVELWVPVRG